MCARSLPMNNRQMLARDVFDHFATRTGLVHVIADTLLSLDTKWQLYSQGRVFATFRR